VTYKTIVCLMASELVLGDRVLLFDDAYGWGTVVKIADEEVHVFRPYVHIGDFSYTGGVLHYIGSEVVKLYKGKDTRQTYNVDSVNHDRMSQPGALK